MYAIMQGLTLMTQVFGTANQMTYHSSSHTLTLKKKNASQSVQLPMVLLYTIFKHIITVM